MSRIFIFVMSMTVLALLLEMSGFGVVVSSVTSLLGISQENFQLGADYSATNTSSLLIIVQALLIGAAASGIVIGFITKSPSENYVVLPFITGTFLIFLSVINGLANVAGSFGPDDVWAGAVIICLMATITTGFIITLLDWFRGNVT